MSDEIKLEESEATRYRRIAMQMGVKWFEQLLGSMYDVGHDYAAEARDQRTREALERVKSANWSRESVDGAIADELAKLGLDKPTSDHVQASKKYARAWLSEQTDDALFDLYMQQIGFFDMNGSMVEREAMIETLASIEQSQDLTGPKKPTKPAVEVRFENVQIDANVDAPQPEKLGRDKLKIDHVHELGSCSFCDRRDDKKPPAGERAPILLKQNCTICGCLNERAFLDPCVANGKHSFEAP
jgi:hypothetical protein